MKYIIFSKFNRYHILFVTYFIIIIIKEIVNDLYSPTKDIVQSFNKYFSYTISDFLSIIPIMIIKYRSKSDSNNSNTLFESKTNQSIENIYTNNFENSYLYKRQRRIIKLMIVISIFDFLGKYSNVTFNIILAKTNYMIKKIKLNALSVVNIIAIYILSILILHSPFYRHHYLSLFINLIFLIALVVIDQINIFKDNDWQIQIYYTILKLLTTIFYSFEDVYGKVLLSIESITPYLLLFCRGIIVGIITLIFSIMFIFIDIPDENGENSVVFTRFWKLYENKLDILHIIGIALINFVFNLHIYFIIDKFSPTHYAMATMIDSFGSLIISIISRNIEIPEFFLRLILCLVLIFVGLIYNEIIILNFCGLQKYTKLFMEKEAKADIIKTKFNSVGEIEIDSEIDNEIMKQEGMNNAIKLNNILDEEDDDTNSMNRNSDAFIY